ncbi:hypothetical protein BH10PSE9_BH10PSE9_07030 [soil metagenome]
MPGKSHRLAGYGLFLAAALFAARADAAADPKKIADALVAALSASGKSTGSYTAATASGNDIVITNLKSSPADKSGDAVVPTVVISGAADRSPGGFTATKMTFNKGSAVNDKDTVTWQTGSITDAVVPSADEIKAKAKLRPFSKLSMGGINVKGPDMAAPVDIVSVDAVIGDVIDGTPSDIKLTTVGLKLPGALFDDPEVQGVLKALGYTEFVVGINLDGGLDAAADVVTIRTLTVDVASVGKLALTGKFSGVSVRGLTSDKSDEAASKARIDSLTFRFDNAGVVEKALDMQAKMTGSTSKQVVTELTGALPFMLSLIGNEAFEGKVAKAATDFLNAPKSITIKAAPAKPVSLEEIGAALSDDPSKLPDLLVVDITANN